MPNGTLLVVEDEVNIGSTLVERLGREGFAVTWTQSVQETLAALKTTRFDLAVLDVGLPDGSGFDLAKTLRAAHQATAILFLTARGNPEDRIRGLELGAEDYVVKPFHLKELLLRIRRCLHRVKSLSDLAGSGDDSMRIGQALIHFSKFSAEVGGVTHALTHKEFAVLKLLLDRRGRVVSRDEILNHAWSEDEFPSSRTIDNFVMRLRRLIEIDVEHPSIITSIRGVGYMLELPQIKKDESS